ncbi:MAG: aldo/keto reductase [Halobacteriovoraceae bacterium]|nr:aldo/keto reductase [Halobacteriovoraceae bacterium]
MGIAKSFRGFPLGFGGGSVSGEGGGYGFGDINDKQAQALLHHAFEKGFRLFDTAPIYGFGLSEIRIGKAFKHMREQVYIVSKSGIAWDGDKRVDICNSPQTTKKMLEQSLRDLDSDYIDLYMVHWPDPRVDIRRPLEVYAKALQAGKIRQAGLCNTNPQDLKKAREIVEIHAVQSEYHLLRRDTLDDLRQSLAGEEISFMSWGTLDKGILTGRVDEDRKFDPVDCRSHAPWWKRKDVLAKVEKIKELEGFLQEHDTDKLRLALAHNLQQENLDIALCGVSSKEQIDGLVTALDGLPAAQVVSSAVKMLET